MSEKIKLSDGDKHIKKKVCEFSPEEIEEIRKNDPNAKIMKVVYDDVEEIMPMHKVKNSLKIIRGMFEQLRKDFPTKTDEEIRKDIREKSSLADKMAGLTHPKLFVAVTNRDSTPDDFNMIMFNIHLRERVERGEISEEDAVTALYTHLIKRQQEGNNTNK